MNFTCDCKVWVASGYGVEPSSHEVCWLFFVFNMFALVTQAACISELQTTWQIIGTPTSLYQVSSFCHACIECTEIFMWLTVQIVCGMYHTCKLKVKRQMHYCILHNCAVLLLNIKRYERYRAFDWACYQETAPFPLHCLFSLPLCCVSQCECLNTNIGL